MTKKSDFNAEEWSLVLEGPPIAGMTVMAAERGGTLRESVSMGKAYTEARQAQGAGELLDEIVAANPEFDRQRFRSAEDLKTQGPRRLTEAVQLLDQRATPQEVDAYKSFILDLADRVARAHKEGGVLGLGGKEVSASEQAALDEIRAVLGSDAT
ncbi:MAG: hypothetical protein H0W05_04265 [Thermoleophilaceae bacterium]|jgi:hypothetical protein|nr:hypothetical protein [Thermoleophilaceae bacterium]